MPRVAMTILAWGGVKVTMLGLRLLALVAMTILAWDGMKGINLCVLILARGGMKAKTPHRVC